jgi:hypothetical protein
MNFTGLYVLHISSWVAGPTIRKAHEPLLRSVIGILNKAVACLHYQTRHCFAMCSNLWKHLLTKWNNIKLHKLFLSCYSALVLSSWTASFRTLSSHLFLGFWGASSCETSFHNLFVHSVIKHPYHLHSPLIFFNTFIFTRSLSLYNLYSCILYHIFQMPLLCTGSDIIQRIFISRKHLLCGSVGMWPRFTPIEQLVRWAFCLQ